MFAKRTIKEWCEDIDGEWQDGKCTVETQDPAYPEGTVSINEHGDDIEVHAGGGLEITAKSWEGAEQRDYEEKSPNSWTTFGHGDVVVSANGEELTIQEHEQFTRIADIRPK